MSGQDRSGCGWELPAGCPDGQMATASPGSGSPEADLLLVLLDWVFTQLQEP